MTWIDVTTLVKGEQDPNRHTCISLTPKVGSTAIQHSLNKVPHTRITDQQAVEYNFRVFWMRSPLERFNSGFNHWSGHVNDNADIKQYIPKGMITAEGHRATGHIGHNQHQTTQTMIDDYGVKVAFEKAKNTDISDNDLAFKFHDTDYQRYMDFILGGAENEHWMPQLDQVKLGDTFIPNIGYRFESINETFNNHVPDIILEHLNHWRTLPHSTYRNEDLKAFYKADLAFWEAIDGAWYAS